MTEIADFDHGRADGIHRATLPSGEYSGLDPADLLAGKHIPEVRLPLSRGPDLEHEMNERDPDLDPQLVWRGKEKTNLNELCAKAPPLFVQERIRPRMLIEDMRRRSAKRKGLADPQEALAGWDDAIEQAKVFDAAVGIDAVILTKIDTDAKGGAALSIAHTIGKPIAFVCNGQEYGDIIKFNTEWMIDRMFNDD